MSFPKTTPIEGTVSCKEDDYLDQDKPIRNQNYVCMSFISPEDVILQKEVVFFNKYVASFSSEMELLFKNLTDKYPDDSGLFDVIRENNSHIFSATELQEQFKFFKSINGSKLESEYHVENKFQTSIRGIKVRGVYDTFEEADIRSKVLKKMGDKHNIFVGQVGCWCPWSPNPEDLENQEYSETQLNTIMKKYKENQDNKDVFYNERKDDKMRKAKAEAEKIKQNNLVSDEPVPEGTTATQILEEASIDIKRTPLPEVVETETRDV
jgi:hypothetical protein